VRTKLQFGLYLANELGIRQFDAFQRETIVDAIVESANDEECGIARIAHADILHVRVFGGELSADNVW
jgi:hypothetical protein